MRSTMRRTAKGATLSDLLLEELKDMYNAEQQMVKTLPKLAKAAGSDELRMAFEEHLEQTKGHVSRIERAFEILDVPARGRKCIGMKGLIGEGKDLLTERLPESVQDAALIGAAQKVEHYEIAAYGTARTHAQLLELNDVADLLAQTLDEEKQTDARLSQLAEDINVQAESGDTGTAANGDGRRRAAR